MNWWRTLSLWVGDAQGVGLVSDGESRGGGSVHQGRDVATIREWTGREVYALREAFGMSPREFAARISVTDRAILRWEASGGEIISRPDKHATLDKMLERAPGDTQARFREFLTAEKETKEIEKAVRQDDLYDIALPYMDRLGMSLRALAKAAYYDPATVSKALRGKKPCGPALAHRIDNVIGANGEFIKAAERKDSASAELAAPVSSNFAQSERLKFGLSLDDEERIIQAVRRPMRVDRSVVTPLAKILAAQRETEDVIGSAPLIKPVTGQLAMLEDLVKESRGPGRPEVIDIAAQWAEYSGWLYTSTGHWQDARAWFDRTSEWATESGNQTLVATSLSFKGHMAFLLGQIGPMIGLTQAALRVSDSWVGQRAYDAHQLARGLAMTGDSEEAVRAVEEGRSLALIAHERSDEKPPWIYYYTLPFYALERGFVYRFLGRDNSTYNNEAIASLTAALNDIGDARSSEWAVEYVYHLAVAYMQAGSPDKVCETALEVLRIASVTGSNRLMERLHGIYVRLAKRWPNEPCVKELGEALR